MKVSYGFEKKPKEFWVDLSKKFRTKTEIAKYLKCGLWPVSYWMNYHSIPLDGRNIAPNKKDIPSKKELENLYKNNSILEISKIYGNVSNVTVRKWFLKHDIKIRTHKENQVKITLPKTKQTNIERYGIPYTSPSYHSKGENELKTWLNSLGFNFHSDKIILNGFELDGYDEKIKTAFEYCGNWWHSSRFKKDKNVHYKKYKECLNKDIRLFTIYESEWKSRKSQIKNFIKGSLGIYKNKIAGRKTKVAIIEKDKKELKLFLDENHIQGSTNFDIGIALYYKNEIVSCMTFGKHHRAGFENILVLNRLCHKDDYMIVGGSKKMFSYIPKDKIIISWSDNRYATGGVYERLGFIKEKELEPDYCYTNKDNKTKSKQSMKKKNISCKPGQTEKERCEEMGYYQLFDCGKIRWIYKT